MFPQVFQVVLLVLTLLSGTDARRMRKSELHARQQEAAKRFQERAAPVTSGPHVERRSGVQNITFSNPKASGEVKQKSQTKLIISISRVLGGWFEFPWSRFWHWTKLGRIVAYIILSRRNSEGVRMDSSAIKAPLMDLLVVLLVFPSWSRRESGWPYILVFVNFCLLKHQFNSSSQDEWWTRVFFFGRNPARKRSMILIHYAIYDIQSLWSRFRGAGELLNPLSTSKVGPIYPACCGSSNQSERVSHREHPILRYTNQDLQCWFFILTWTTEREWSSRTTSRIFQSVFGHLFWIEGKEFLVDGWKCTYHIHSCFSITAFAYTL